MKKRLRDVIDSLDYYELLKIKKDLESGGNHLLRFIEHHIEQRQKEHAEYCAVSGEKIDPQNNETFTLVFGPSGFKKKVTVSGKDSLEYFVKHLDDMKQGKFPKTVM